jgi:hypothetical protein
MLNIALKGVAEKLNTYLKNRFSFTKDKVEISPVLRADDSKGASNPERITISLVNITQEKNIKTPVTNPANSPIYLNLQILFCVYFGEEGSYEQALKELSAIISFFQANPVLTSQNTPEFGNGIDKMVFNLENMEFNLLQNMWSMLGGKHTPSVLYKVNMVAIDEGNASMSAVVGVGF